MMDIFGSGTPLVDPEVTLHDVLMRVEGVSLRYGNNQVLNDINFKIQDVHRPGVKQGQVVSLIGRSGIGKSQLFRILAGFNPIKSVGDKTMSGSVLLNKEQTPVRLGEVGVVTQNYKLFEWRTVKNNLLFTGASLETVKEYAEGFDLKEHLNKFPGELSGGQRQRVAIIQQVLTGNNFLLLDEPFSGLDSIMKKKTIDLLLKISTLDELKTLIIISHDIESSLAISDAAFIITKEEGGATIKQENKFNLIERGLAWHPEIKEMPGFRQLLKEIDSKI